MTLSLSRNVSVAISMSPKAAQKRGFGVLGILGDSAVIGSEEGYREYTSSDAVGSDFGTTAPEYLAALAYFSQSPKPKSCVIFRWFNSGDDAETIADALSRILDSYSRIFYGLVTATSVTLTDDQKLEIAQTIEASSVSHIYGITLTDKSLYATAYSEESDDIASKLKRGSYSRTLMVYADYDSEDTAYRLNPYFVASCMGRMFSVDFTGSRTTLTLKFKQAPSIQPSDLSETQANRLEDRNINVYAIYENDTYIIEQGVMADGSYADERHNLDWLQDAMQTTLYNALYQSKTKYAQTEDDVARLQAKIEAQLQQAVKNGMVAAGTWNADGFGDLSEGDYLESGYYVYHDAIADQDQSDREARICPPFQIAIKLAGAIHSVDVTINVNR